MGVRRWGLPAMVLAQEPGNRFSGNANGATGGDRPDPASRSGQDASEQMHPTSRLAGLLAAYPVDLGAVGREIHASPKLEFLVMTLAGSLILAPETPALTLEDAAIVLGRDR